MDVGDSDPATFMHYLRQAAQALLGKRGGALPVFTSEPQQDLARFARSFCRELFAALPQGTLIVLDNFQEARSSADQRTAFAAALEEIPEGINVVVLSRTDPPQEFARLAARRQIARIDVSDLRCTEDEALALLGGTPLDRDTVRRIQHQSDGWAAALVLLREHLSRPHATVEESLGEGRDAIFQYFAGEIFARAKPANQRALMVMAILPSITTAEAVDLVGSEDVARLLEYLYRRHLFVDRRRGVQTTWHYHALFREFLQEEGRRRLPAAERRALCARAAALLEARGEDDGALALYREAGEFEPMRRLVLAHALDWARHGRSQALSDAIDALPEAMRAGDPWLAYWQGRAWIFVEAQRGRASLERAFAAFKRAGDLRGQALALNTIVTGYYYEWANFAPIDRWIPEFAELLEGARAAALDADSELRARSAWLIALLFRRPDDPALAPCAQRLDALIDGEPDPNARIMAASVLFNYFNWCTKGESAGALVARTEPLLARPDVAPLMQLWWRTHLAFWHYVNGRYERSQAVSDEARTIAERYGLTTYLFEIDHAEASALVTRGRARRGASADGAARGPPVAVAADGPRLFPLPQANLEQRLRHFTAAVRAAERAVALARETGLPAMQVPHFLVRLAHARIAAGDTVEGLRAFDEAIALAGEVDRRSFAQQRELIGIGIDLDAGEHERAAVRLAAVLAEYRSNGQTVILRNRPDLAARLADFALGRGIETDYVRLLIERNALPAPADAGPAWPFRLRIRALGGFELVRDGQPMRFSGKAQQRPLDSSRWSSPRAVPTWTVHPSWRRSGRTPMAPPRRPRSTRRCSDCASCWTSIARSSSPAASSRWPPSSSGPTCVPSRPRSMPRNARARRAPRARRLLGPPGRSSPRTRAAPRYGRDSVAREAPRRVSRARAARRHFARCALEAARDWATAVDVYRRGLEADNLAEPLYRGLMRSLAATGDRAEALVAFRRCRDLLSVVLGLKPSAETERLHRDISKPAGVIRAAPRKRPASLHGPPSRGSGVAVQC